MAQNQSTNSGVGIAGLLGLLFVGLKLGGVINWSWWWVTLPFWGGTAIVVLFLIIYLAYAFATGK